MANQALSDTSTVTIEAPTVEEALGMLNAELGPGARILRADRIRRGGFAGFFARELIEIEAEMPEAAASNGVAATFDRMLEAAESDSTTALSSIGTDAATRPVLTAAPPAALTGGGAMVATVSWDGARMLEVGLPGALIQAVAALDPIDDLGHLNALVAALAPVCGPLPTVPMRLVGRRADRLRAAVGIEESENGPIHLVVGDDLPDALPGVPAVVSWVSDRGAARAISLALGTGALLGYGIASGFGAPARRISAVDAAVALRDLMERS